MHTPRCNHATGSVCDYAAAAVQAGLKEIGISDHSPMPGGFDKAWRMQRSELAGYLEEIEEARGIFSGRLEIRTGLEADFYPGCEAYLEEMLGAHDWDYVIGSVHYIGEWAFDNPDCMETWSSRSIDDAYCDYFDLLAASAATGMFDIIGHPDLIKKFGHRPSPESGQLRAAEERMLQAVLKANTTLEISSAGLRKPVGEIYPHARIVARAAELGIPFAFGSDAHAPGEVAHAMDACLTMLENNGIGEIAGFRQRERQMIPLIHA